MVFLRSIARICLYKALKKHRTVYVSKKKKPLNRYGKHEAVSLELLGPSHFDHGCVLLLPISDSKAKVFEDLLAINPIL